MNFEADNFAEIAAALKAGKCTETEQLSLSLRLALAVPRVRKIERFRDEVVLNAQEDAEIAERAKAAPGVVSLAAFRMTRRAHVVRL